MFYKEISCELKKNVLAALEVLGEGFLAYLCSRRNELEDWRRKKAPSLNGLDYAASPELLEDIYHESLSLTYRLLFLFYAGSRRLESIRDEIIAAHDNPLRAQVFSRGETILWERLTAVFRAVRRGWRNSGPASEGELFDPLRHEFLERFKVCDYYLARAIDLLSRTRDCASGRVGRERRKIDYRELDIRHLGTIYESSLEYHAEVADREKVVIKRGKGERAAEERVNTSDLTARERRQLNEYLRAFEEDEESPRGCRITGLIPRGQYYLARCGPESRRKSSGSFYTPAYVVRYIVEHTLGALVRGEHRAESSTVLLKERRGSVEKEVAARPLSSEEILKLKVLDPAMGAGHFLLAATEYLARAYLEARIREGKDSSVTRSASELVRYKRMIAERCIYGVDIDPMAVELARLSMWLFTMEEGRPHSFLNHQLKAGNALLCARIKDLGHPPEPDKRRGQKKRALAGDGKENLFELRFREKAASIMRDLSALTNQETVTFDDVRLKRTLGRKVEEALRPFRNLADIWMGLHFGERSGGFDALLLNVEDARSQSSEKILSVCPFHWELEFPEVWFDPNGEPLADAGFSAVIGNPPYVEGKNLRDTKVLRLLYTSHAPRAGDDVHPSSAKLNAFCLFLELGLELMGKRGLLGFMVPATFLRNKRYWRIREIVLQSAVITNICEVTDYDAAAVECISLILSRSAEEGALIKVDQINSGGLSHVELISPTFSRRDHLYQINVGLSADDLALMAAVEESCRPLSEICETRDGVNPGRADFRKVFLGARHREVFKPLAHDSPEYAAEELARPYKFNPAIHKPTCEGCDIAALAPLPATKHHLVYSEEIACVERFFVPGTRWSAQLRQRAIFEQSPKILSRQTADTIIATIDTARRYPVNNVHVTSAKSEEVDLYLIAALLNSNLMRWYYRRRTGETGRTFPQVHVYALKQLPMPEITAATKLAELRSELRDSLAAEGLQGTHLQVISSQDASLRQAWLSEVARMLCATHASSRADRERLLRFLNDATYSLYSLSSIQLEKIETKMQTAS